MKILSAFLIIMLAATPALAKNYGAHNKKEVGCTPSTDPDVKPCGFKDEAPVYFPDKLAKPATDDKPVTASTKKGKKTKVSDDAPPAPDAPAATPPAIPAIN